MLPQAGQPTGGTDGLEAVQSAVLGPPNIYRTGQGKLGLDCYVLSLLHPGLSHLS